MLIPVLLPKNNIFSEVCKISVLHKQLFNQANEKKKNNCLPKF